MKHADDLEYTMPAVFCLTGFFLHILLSDPLLNALGMHYSGEEGSFFEKLHPGTYMIFFSLLVLLCSGGNFFERFFEALREQRAAMYLLLLYIVLFFYMALRSGFAGLAFMLDTHIASVICAIVLCHAPAFLCRKAVNFFILAAVANSVVGIAEATWKFRLFSFDADWSVLHETYFRASAFLGHPLDNAAFTVIALFVLLALDYPRIAKMMMGTVFMMALVAFGGRASILIAVAGIGALAAKFFWQRTSHGVSLRGAIFSVLMFFVAPLACAALFYLAMHSAMGERVAASTGWDSSANSRLTAFRAFSFMHDDELWLGVSLPRVLSITYLMQQSLPVIAIENPWVLMCMYLGLITFPFWLAATTGFIFSLMKGRPFPLQYAAIAYFLIASTYNSFGRKDANYLIMVSSVVCASRLLEED